VETVLNGEGIAIDSPIPPGLLPGKTKISASTENLSEENRIAAAKKILQNAKWVWNDVKKIYEKKNKKETVELAFSISTSNAPELQAAAEMLKTMWEKIGASVTLKISEIGELNQNVIRSRKYDALLFGEIIGRDLDLFAFWHSSQRNDPGLNIALYTNAKADKLLEDARAISDQNTRFEKYAAFEREIKGDIPAIFIYSPDFLYVVPKRLKGFNLGRITVPAERFLNIEKWHLETDHVWQIFAPES
jgi:peptide/nickel transport system substrate-binding protein